MSHTANTGDSCLDDGARSLTPISPFLGLNYHFGMLLGVDDFGTEQAYHRGKMRLHNAWMHRDGVVWGLKVELDTERGEVRVLPGLALDGAGHELHLEADACVNLGAWFEKHKDDADFEVTENEGEFTFDAHVVIAHRACLTRQVPALSEPCEGSGADTAYSRVFETVELLLVPGPAPQPTAPANHFLRLMFGLDVAHTQEDGTVEPVDQAVLDAREAIAALPRAEQQASWITLFRQLAAADEMAFSPAVDPETGELLLFPALDRAPVLLAEIKGIVLEKQAEWIVSAGEVLNEVRPAHVPTKTIQELLCAHLCAQTPTVDGGPRIDRASVAIAGAQITFNTDKELHAASVKPTAFAASSFDATAGWQDATIAGATYDATTKTVTLTLSAPLGGAVQRVLAYGTGKQPLLGVDFVPLAGGSNDSPASAHDGRDFVFTRTVS